MFLLEIYENQSGEPLSFLMPLLIMLLPLVVASQHVHPCPNELVLRIAKPPHFDIIPNCLKHIAALKFTQS